MPGRLERSVPGALVAVLNRNNSDNRLELMTDVRETSTLPSKMQGADPDACMAIRIGRAHGRDEQVAPLLECEICGTMPGSSLCTPSLVGGEVIGSVLIEHPDRIARLKGSDPEGYRRYRRDTKLFQPPPDEVVHIDTTNIRPKQNAESIYEMLRSRGFQPPSA